jgi:transcription elongation factor GreB
MHLLAYAVQCILPGRYTLGVSKAFKGEDASEAPRVVPPRAPLPPGVDNYVTPRGLAALRAEHRRLLSERARVETSPEGADRLDTLAVVDQRLVALEERLASAHPVDPASQPREEARFGATVTVRAENGAEHRYRIVGVDEADAQHGSIAFVAPLARVLLGKRAGDTAHLRTPRREEELEILAVEYEES